MAQPATKTLAEKENYERVFTKVESLAYPKGGYFSWKKYLDTSLTRHNVYFPESDSVSKVIDSVTVTFIVSKQGKLSDFKIISGSNLFVNNLALTLLKKSDNWEPAVTSSGNLVNSLRRFSMKFEMDYAIKMIRYLPADADY